MQRQKITIVNKLGLHARASAKLVSLANRYGASVELTKNDKTVNGKSIMGVMMLAAAKGSEIEIVTNGEDEQEAMQAIVALINNRFDEEA